MLLTAPKSELHSKICGQNFVHINVPRSVEHGIFKI